MDKKKAVQYIGNGIVILALIYIFVKLCRYREELIHIFQVRLILVMIIGVLIYTILQQINAIFYKQIVCAVTNKSLSTALIVPLYTKSNLYKYLPGNVMHYVGRNQIAVLSEATHPQVIVCTLLELIVQISSAFGVALILSFNFVNNWVSASSLLPYIILSGIILIAILLLLYAKIFRKKTLYKKIKISKELCIILLKAALYYAFFQAVSGILFLILMNIMEINIPPNYIFTSVGVYCFAWLVGLITPGAPGGLGVREVMLEILLGTLVHSELIAAAVVLNRIITTLGDLLAYPLSLLVFGKDYFKKHQNANNT